MMDSDALYRMLYEYDNLEAAYQAAFDFLEDPPEDEDAWLINLQNHLIWKSYLVTQDGNADTVVLEAITSLAKRLGLGPYDVTGETRRILDELTLV